MGEAPQRPVVEDGDTRPGVPDAFQRLWTPHRAAYVSAPDPSAGQQAERPGEKPDDDDACPFCAAPRRSDEDALIVHRGETCYVLLNLYPYNPGHLLVCPYRHVSDLTELDAAERAEVGALSATAMTVLRRVSGPHGFNLGMNQGAVAGAGIAGHLHQHVVPRWSGDANFFPIVARTKAMPQVLGDTRAMIADGWRAHPGGDA